jgi:hypothetical protein
LGIAPLYPEELTALCHFLDVTPTYLLDLDGN